MANNYTGMPPNNGGGGKFGSNDGGKPSYLSHVPDEHLSAHTKHANHADSMSHTNLMACKAGGGEKSRK